MAIHFHSGPWSAAYHSKLENGPADLEYRVSPDTVAFRKALAKQEGSVEAATELLAHYNSMISKVDVMIAHKHLPVAED